MSARVRILKTNLFLILVFSQCVLFEPKINKVPDAYVRDEVMNAEQKNATRVLTDRIIKLNNEVSAQRKANTLTAQAIKISQTKVAKHSAQRDLARSKETYFVLKEDSATSKRYLEESQGHELERAKEETRYKTWVQKEKEDKAYLEMKEAALGELIAELELVRSEIAVKFQESQGKTPADPEYIKKEIYETQYAEKKSDARRRVSDWERVKAEAPSLPKVNLEDSFDDAK
ncbi:hypothetical protein [Leptospira meyeri]|uniref:Uncharacterized protein n=1 Tax=Leptospira meyeri TaxID=29508 RepID=A0A4R8MVG5_LEPME|nr:hypothetical protein [Leptospira meyeri]EKJ85452.1 hypothetical protein LEP1GSC017_3599 [Leptospira meyeri serovar Hardjo str. Went 5]EMJ86844.1 hypothetical protein LEP1GSC196_3314 [Leptospira meyeri serovar Semaranga str. Veldrot Semarang 173]TDY71412.1 hypothetical protein CLV96_0374 [Leptospira meyeri]